MSAPTKLDHIPHPIVEFLGSNIVGKSPFRLDGYSKRLKAAQVKAPPNLDESWTTGVAQIGDEGDNQYVFATTNFAFLGGTLSAASGTRIVNAIRTATEHQMPFIAFVNSGGVRTEEHAIALMQMPRIEHELAQHRRAGLTSVGIFRRAVTGGARIVFGEGLQILVAHSDAYIALSGGRIYEARLKEKLPDGELMAPHQNEKGHVDLLIASGPYSREKHEREAIEVILGLQKIPTTPSEEPDHLAAPEQDSPHGRYQALVSKVRATGPDYARTCFDDYLPLRGHEVINTGIARTQSGDVMVISHDRFTNDGQITDRDMAVALHALEVARDRGMRVITLIDCAGAEPTLRNEYSPFSASLVRFGTELLEHPRPTASVVIGEFGSGIGAQFASTDMTAALNGAAMFTFEPIAYAALRDKEGFGEAEAAALMEHSLASFKRAGVIDAVRARSYRSVEKLFNNWLDLTAAIGEADIDIRLNRFDRIAASATKRSLLLDPTTNGHLS